MRGPTGLLLSTLVLLAACGGDDDGNGDEAAAGETVAMTARDFVFEPENVTLDAAGTYTFRVTNEGDAPHALEIESDDLEEETDTIDPGGSAELTVELAEGEYVLYCPVGDHRDRGMEGRLVVGAAAAGGGATETDGDTDAETNTETDGDDETDVEYG